MPIAKMSIIEFGKQLVETGDLDPLYIALWEANLPRQQLCRWLVCYFCYYHAGLCCWASEQKDEWGTLDRIARGGTAYPRGSERRHFRGQFAITAIEKLRNTFSTAEEMIEWVGNAGPRADKIMARVKSLYGFGEWISGKVPDICERLQLFTVEFTDRDVDLMFSSPKKSALKIAEQYAPSSDPLMSAHKYVINHLGHLKSPPRYERGLTIQESETIFCKFGSYLTGHYPIGKDSIEIRHGLLRYAKCKTSQKLLKHLPVFRSA